MGLYAVEARERKVHKNYIISTNISGDFQEYKRHKAVEGKEKNENCILEIQK